MKKVTSYFCLLLFLAAACTAELTEDTAVVSTDGTVVVATASLPDFRTKMIFEDSLGGKPGIKAGWESGDTFLALEINGSAVTPVTFTATAAADVKTTFTSKGAVPAGDDTRWVAVLGKKASFDGQTIKMTYSDQDGTLDGLENYDYMVAVSSGTAPDFDYSGGSHLTYLLKIKMPGNVGIVEFNTAEGDREWTVRTDGKASACVADYRPKAVKTMKLKASTTVGQYVYLAVPAIDYSDAGLIVTAMSADMKTSQGKVASEDFSGKGGQVGNYSMEELLLMDRPSGSQAISFGSYLKSSVGMFNNTSYSGIPDSFDFLSSPCWAPYNLGASAKPACAEDTYGTYFTWGETEQKGEGYTGYRYSGRQETIGMAREYVGKSGLLMTLRQISGTKYDPARVKWGSAWRMPRLEEFITFTGDNETFTPQSGSTVTTNNRFKTYEKKSYYGIDVAGRVFSMDNVEIFFPYAGRISATSTEVSNGGKAGYYRSGTLNNIPGSGEAYRFYVRGNQVDYLSQSTDESYPVRPVLARETDEPVPPVLISGRVVDISTGNGIKDVNISDGYSCTLTDAEGNYTIKADAKTRTISVTVPSAYEIPLDEDGCPAFFRRIDISSVSGPIDFPFTPRASADSRFTIISVADAHVQTESNLTRFSNVAIPDIQETIAELEASGTAGNIIGIGLGDQLWDNLSIASDVRRQYTSLHTSKGTVPFFYCIGNHDHESKLKNIESDPDFFSTAKFVESFGPVNYSFDIGNAHIIVMDDIQYNGYDESSINGTSKIQYSEGITGAQVRWLEQDISNVKDKSSKVGIFCTHSPVYNAIGNWSAIHKAMRQFNESHILSGHIHNLTNDSYGGIKAKGGRQIIEHNIQSLAGMWWLGDLSPNGTPSGYGVFTFNGGVLEREYNKVTKEDETFQIRVYSGNDKYSTGFGWDGEYNGKFLVRVWDGDDPEIPDSEQTWWVDFVQNGKSVEMTRLPVSIIDKCAASYIVDILGSPYGTGGTAKSFSWWMINAPCGNPARETDWEVVARHKIGNGPENIYRTSTLTTDRTGYAIDEPFIK